MNILFLEDNIGGISSLAVSLRHLKVQCTITSDLNGWKTAILRFQKAEKKFDLLILDDNIYKETTLEKLDRPNIGTNGGSSTGSKLVSLLRSDNVPKILNEYTKTPIIIYSVHNPVIVKKGIGELDDVFVFEKLKGQLHEQKILDKCIELLGL